MVCKSLNAGEWIPLDKKIQHSAWTNKKFYKSVDFKYWGLSEDDEFIMLIVRSIFDKKKFISGYIERIQSLYQYINISFVIEKLELVFFKFSTRLFEKLEKKEYETIINEYIEFRDY